MRRPVYLKVELYEHILKEIAPVPFEDLKSLALNLGYNLKDLETKDELTELLLHRPGPFLVHTGLLENEDWLTNLILVLDDGVDYWITESAAHALASNDDYILLTRLIDKEPIVNSREVIKQAFQNNYGIDYVGTSKGSKKSTT